MDFDGIRTQLSINEAWRARSDGLWLNDPELDVERMARVMMDLPARLVTITALAAGDECRLVYHWDFRGTLLNLGTITRQGSVTSIVAICPAADWIEREIHDYYAVKFTGRGELVPIVLRASDTPGLFHWNGDHQEREG